jgi:hypothetical protein
MGVFQYKISVVFHSATVGGGGDSRHSDQRRAGRSVSPAYSISCRHARNRFQRPADHTVPRRDGPERRDVSSVARGQPNKERGTAAKRDPYRRLTIWDGDRQTGRGRQAKEDQPVSPGRRPVAFGNGAGRKCRRRRILVTVAGLISCPTVVILNINSCIIWTDRSGTLFGDGVSGSWTNWRCHHGQERSPRG